MFKSKYFTSEEFECKCCGKEEMDQAFIGRLNEARRFAGTSFVVNSGFRCPKHNKEVKGKEDSAHLYGLAADIETKTDSKRYRVVTALLDAGFTRIGIGNGFVHVDEDRKKNFNRMWVY